MVLATLPGIGERLMKRLDDHFGGRDEVMETLQSGDISRIAEVEGISVKRALQLARQVHGTDGTFLATKESERLHTQLIQSLQSFASCSATSSRMQMLMPMHEIEHRRTRCVEMMNLAKEDIQAFERLQNIFKQLGHARKPSQRYERVVVSREEQPEWSSFVRVLQPSPSETWNDYTVFKTVTWIGNDGPDQVPPGWLVLPANAEKEIMVPEYTIDWFKNNKKILSSLIQILQWKQEWKGTLPPVLKQIFSATEGLEELSALVSMLGDAGDIESMEAVRDSLWKTSKSLEESLNSRIAAGMETASLDLSGSDMLAALADAATFQRKLAQATENVIDEALQEGRKEMAEYLEITGINCPHDLYSSSWPVKIKRPTLDQIDAELERRINDSRSEHLVRSSRKLAALKPRCEVALRTLIEHDMWYSISRWALHHEAELPELVSHGVWFEEGRHLFIEGIAQPVSYGLGDVAPSGDRQPIALLTGANSGGKTTLLELVAHITLLAHMGLPVPAKNAFVGRIESLHVLAKSGGTQSAGALETTLVELAQVVCNDTPKLILADELEAITEPGAGARIIAGMLRAAQQQTKTTMVLVTHLAPAILEAYGGSGLRVDGIEANGLDEHLELIVDRTPKRNCLARSTPELIVRRLVERSNGSAKDVFTDILSLF